ncbi:MAG: acylneuraminate cytidylyltransferase, partial [Flavobacteriales bacterium]|nr:acylneuraminate cytidylyltransferase [Flavobacteriales bacterium]MBT7619686.1 acylneuraminate cytidylyltransferase [Flavobacteriales bacterium]
MSVIAFVPARGGSKSIPEKNIKYFCGKPLIYWNLHELQKSEVDEIVVATDSDNIKLVVESFKFSKVKVYDRSSENSQDTSSTES